MCNNPGPFISTIHKAIDKIRKGGDLNADSKRPKTCLILVAPENALTIA